MLLYLIAFHKTLLIVFLVFRSKKFRWASRPTSATRAELSRPCKKQQKPTVLGCSRTQIYAPSTQSASRSCRETSNSQCAFVVTDDPVKFESANTFLYHLSLSRRHFAIPLPGTKLYHVGKSFSTVFEFEIIKKYV